MRKHRVPNFIRGSHVCLCFILVGYPNCLTAGTRSKSRLASRTELRLQIEATQTKLNALASEHATVREKMMVLDEQFDAAEAAHDEALLAALQARMEILAADRYLLSTEIIDLAIARAKAERQLDDANRIAEKEATTRRIKHAIRRASASRDLTCPFVHGR